MKNIYLVLTIAGAIVPYVFFTSFFLSEGVNVTGFVGALFANGAAGGFTADLLFSSFVFWIMLVQMQARRIWLFVLLNLTIGLSCALPAWLYFRERDRVETP